MGALVGMAYALIATFVATTPLRGLTPPPGQSREPLDAGIVLVAIGFAIAALLIAVGKPVSPRR